MTWLTDIIGKLFDLLVGLLGGSPLLVMLVAYAAATECLQWFVGGRTPELTDLVQNVCGIAAAVAVCWICIRMRVQIIQYANP